MDIPTPYPTKVAITAAVTSALELLNPELSGMLPVIANRKPIFSTAFSCLSFRYSRAPFTPHIK